MSRIRTKTGSSRRTIPLNEQLAATPAYTIYRTGYTTINRGLSISRLQAELLALHGTRRIRHMDSGEILADAQARLVDANMQNQSYRSRAAEIRLRLFIAHAALAELQDRYWKWASSHYAAELAALGLRSQDAKWSYIAATIEEGVTRLSRLDTAIKVADQVIEDIDSCGYALLRINNAVALSLRDRHEKN